MLNLPLSFQLESWLDELRAEKDYCEEIANSTEAAHRLHEQCSSQRESSLDACLRTIMEGKTLLQELRYVGVLIFRVYSIIRLLYARNSTGVSD